MRAEMYKNEARPKLLIINEVQQAHTQKLPPAWGRILTNLHEQETFQPRG